MDRGLFVRVFVPTLGENGEDGEDKKGCTGTAYPVSSELILTARHVVRPPNRQEKYRISIVWEGDAAKIWHRLDENCIVWEGGGSATDLDAALLRCACPKPMRPAIVSGARPQSIPTFAWSSAGFADAGKSEKWRDACGFGGTMSDMTENASQFEIFVSEGKPEEALDWRGASGMPLFRKGTNEILGIAKAVPMKFGAAKLFAVPAWKLRQAPGFLQALGDEENSDRISWFREHLVTVLTRSPLAQRELAKTTQFQQMALAGAAKPTDAIVERLLELPLHAAIATLSEAYESVKSQAVSPAGKAAFKALQTMLGLLAPALYDSAVVNHVRRQVSDSNVVFCGPVCSLHTVAEIVMAAVDRRPTEFRHKADQEFPDGKRHLPSPPEGGIGSEKQYHYIREALVSKLFPETWRDLRGQIDDRVIRAMVHSNQMAVDRAHNITRAENALKAQVKRRNTYYLICQLPVDEQIRNGVLKDLKLLKQDFPSLVILTIFDDPDLMTHEMAVFIDFNLMLP